MAIDLKDFQKKLLEIGNRIITESGSNGIIQTLGDGANSLIKKRTRLGYGVSSQEGDKERLNPLSDSYKKQRKLHPKSSDTTPTKSNLTRTGDMLNSLTAEVGQSSVKLTFKGKLNIDKAGFVTEGGRPFMNLSKAEVNQLKKLLNDTIFDRIKTLL